MMGILSDCTYQCTTQITKYGLNRFCNVVGASLATQMLNLTEAYLFLVINSHFLSVFL